MISRLGLLLFASLAICGPVLAQHTAIVGANVFYGTGAAPYVATIVIDAGKIIPARHRGQRERVS